LDTRAVSATATGDWAKLANYQVTNSFSTTVYYAHAWGKGVIAAIYPKDANGQFVYLETNFHF
jgi:hypothetical protein